MLAGPSGRGGHAAAATAACLWHVLPHGCSCAGSALDMESLCLASGRTCWVIFVDGLVLNADGSIVDALSMAVKVCLVLVLVRLAWPDRCITLPTCCS